MKTARESFPISSNVPEILVPEWQLLTSSSPANVAAYAAAVLMMAFIVFSVLFLCESGLKFRAGPIIFFKFNYNIVHT